MSSRGSEKAASSSDSDSVSSFVLVEADTVPDPPKPDAWEVRLDRARNHGHLVHLFLAGKEPKAPTLPAFEANFKHLKNRVWVLVQGSQCCHSGASTRFADLRTHLVPAKPSEGFQPLFAAFPSQKEAKAFWEAVFPGAPFLLLSQSHPQAVCDPQSYQ